MGRKTFDDGIPAMQKTRDTYLIRYNTEGSTRAVA